MDIIDVYLAHTSLQIHYILIETSNADEFHFFYISFSSA